MLKKILTILFLILCFISQSAYCATFSTDFAKVISEQDLDRKSVVSIVAKDINTKDCLYKKNSDKLLNAASSIKLLTFASALNTLGANYKFETAFYYDGVNLYLKLGADPLLTKSDIFELTEKIKKSVNFRKVKYIYIDDTIISQKPYPDGWTVDDFWPVYAPIGPYEIDKNLVKIKLITTRQKDGVTIVQNDKYKFSFINKIRVSNEKDIKISKDYSQLHNVLTLSGTVVGDTELIIPVGNPKAFFISRLEEAFGKYSIPYRRKFYFKKTPKNARKIAVVSHTIEQVSNPILKQSDNFAAETLFRVAANKYARNLSLEADDENSLGTTANGILMFKDYYKKAGLDVDEINLVDASGVSRYNAFSANWISDAIIFLDKTANIRHYMEGADEGTLSKRLRYLKGNLWAKTGTLYGVSSLSGILKSAAGKDIAFSIIIQSYSKSQTALKAFEDDIVDCIFNL